MSVRLMASVAVLGAVAACGGAASSANDEPPARAHHAALTTVSVPTAAGNRAKTRTEAARLLRLAPVPPGARPTSLRSHQLSGPALGVGSTQATVDRHRFYLVDEPYDEVYRYLKQHRPKGLTSAGESAGSKWGVTTSKGIAWSEPDTRYAVELGASAGVVPEDHRTKTLLRVDGSGEWLDPRPVKDTTTGHRVHVDATGACPSSARHIHDVTNDSVTSSEHATLARRLLLAGVPTSALICQFDGANAKPVFGLGRSVSLESGAAHRLAHRVAKIPLAHVDGAVYHCPFDDGSVDLVAFGYRGGTSVDLWIRPAGCSSTDNGVISAMGAPSLRPWAAPLPMFRSAAPTGSGLVRPTRPAIRPEG